jgi:GTP-binding protein
MAGSEGRDPISDLEILRREIREYDEDLAKFPWIVVANKMDLPEAAANLENFQSRFPKTTIIPISADKGEGLEELKRELDERVAFKPKA